MQITLILVGFFFALPLVGGCSGGASRPDDSRQRLALDRSQAEPAATTGPSVAGSRAQRAAVIDGSIVSVETMRAPLMEAAGAVVLEEIVLDRGLARALDRAGIRMTAAMVAAEERALLDELANVADGANRAELLDQIKRTRGLGPGRFERLLERNAGLRALVAPEAEPEPEELRLAERIAFGRTHRVRLLVAPTEAAASEARVDIMRSPDPAREWTFADRCVATSVHPTAPRGGLIEAFSANDPAYPDVLRDAVRRLEPGQISPVLVTRGGFALVLVESVSAAREPSAGERDRVARRVRSRKQRLAMEQLAQQLLARSAVSPIDPDLAEAWRARRDPPGL